MAAALSGRRKDRLGTGREITEPKKAMLASHLEERRGSSVIPAEGKYLRLSMNKTHSVFFCEKRREPHTQQRAQDKHPESSTPIPVDARLRSPSTTSRHSPEFYCRLYSLHPHLLAIPTRTYYDHLPLGRSGPCVYLCSHLRRYRRRMDVGTTRYQGSISRHPCGCR